MPVGESFEFILSQEQYDGVRRIISKRSGQIVSETPVEKGIHLKITKNAESSTSV
jgi:hypothetical protein